jgi:ribonuclease D
MSDFDWISSPTRFAELVTELQEVEAYALDTEFHRERTFLPVLGLVQIATGDRVALIDPLTVDVTGLHKVFAAEGTCVMHAASQDLEILELACGAVPRHLFDTQIAALFCGYRASSLARLVEGFLGIQLDKSAQLTDWTQRPLPRSDAEYAASDVAHLLDLRRALTEALEERGRLAWAEEEFERLRTKDRTPAEPETLWWKLRGKTKLNGKTRAVAQELTKWRQQEARLANRPPRAVLSDMAVLALAQRPAKDAAELRRVRNFDPRHFKHIDGVLEAIQRGLALPREAVRLPPRKPDNLPNVDGVISLCLAWLAQRASEEDLDLSVLGTREDVTNLVLHQPSRLASGWRSALIGKELAAIVDGTAALRVNGTVLELVDRPAN